MGNKDRHILKTLIGQVVEVLDKPNRNGRIYTTQLVQDKIINDIVVKEQLEQHMMFGEFKPDCNYCIDASRVSHAISNLYIEGDKLKADIDILDTPNGRVVMEYLNKGGQVYPILCGSGDLIPIEDGDVVTNYDFYYIALTNFKHIMNEEE